MLIPTKATSITMFITESTNYDLKINFPKAGKKYVSQLIKLEEIFEETDMLYSTPNYVPQLSAKYRKVKERVRNIKELHPNHDTLLSGMVEVDGYSYTVDVALSATKAIGIIRYKYSTNTKETKKYIAFDRLDLSRDGETGFYKASAGIKGAPSLAKRCELQIIEPEKAMNTFVPYAPVQGIRQIAQEMNQERDVYAAKEFAHIALNNELVKKEIFKITMAPSELDMIKDNSSLDV
ncbi:hypothetical protein BC476_06020 [Vibrio parahaemolyticus]|uniref:hypothetical protein n=1 Tax=Vibrio parahaemolyticus TaxID=670 RepID=UPI00083AA0A1|nr:hypothetical protein [Vibrio parahaemolyticus]ODA49496.1 hypothetical protein BC476_06020 [Vibrio parahaemolyticus]